MSVTFIGLTVCRNWDQFSRGRALAHEPKQPMLLHGIRAFLFLTLHLPVNKLRGKQWAGTGHSWDN